MRFNKKVRYLVLASFCFYLIGLANNATSMFVLCWALLSLLGVAWVLPRLALSGLVVEQQVMRRRAFAGDPLPTALEVSNQGGFPKSNILLQNPWRNETLNLEAAQTYLVQWLAGNQKLQVPTSIMALHRGQYRLGPTQAVVSDPWGIFELSQPLGGEKTVLVYPRPVALPRFFPGRPKEIEAAHPLAPQPLEAGLDLHGVREYQPGDDLRRVHWKTTAHAGKLFIREFEKSWPLWATVVLDLHREWQFGSATESSVEYSVGVAASVCYRLLQQGYHLRFLACDVYPVDLRTESRASNLFPILEFLAVATGAGTVPVERLLASHLASFLPGSLLLLITASTAPELAEMLTSLSQGGIRVVVLALAPHSFLPSLEGEWSEVEGAADPAQKGPLHRWAKGRSQGTRWFQGFWQGLQGAWRRGPTPSSSSGDRDWEADYHRFVDHLRTAGITVCSLHRGDDPAACLQVGQESI